MAMCVVLYASRLRMRLTEQNMVWRSRVAGRARTIGNRVYPKRVSRVQIPPSPPEKTPGTCNEFRGFSCFTADLLWTMLDF